MSRNWLIVLGIILLTLASVLCVSASCPPSGCGASTGDWESKAQEFLNSDVPIVGVSQTGGAAKSSFKAGDAVKNATQDATLNTAVAEAQMGYTLPAYRSDPFPKGRTLKAMQSVSSSDLVLDVSSSRDQGEASIRDAVHISFKNFLYENGTIKPISDISKTLSDAGVSSNDRVVVYSDTFESGDSAFVFWLMKHIGHEDVKLLDGDLYDWTAASLPLDTKQKTLPPVNYTAKVRPELLADYNYVKSEEAQTVDARSFQEFGEGRIPNALFISSEDVLEKGRIKDAPKLNETFAKLDKNRPTVVYSSDVRKASLVWYALQLMGFDSRIYTWQDWQAHEKSDT